MRSFLLLALLTFPAAAQPVTVAELFTSQGCSSCPPADALLAELAAADPGLLPLDLHVTYWDRLGWKDPWSLAAATERQRRYSALMGSEEVYTPQIVIDGRFQAIGSDRAAVTQAIARARDGAARIPLGIEVAPNGFRLHAGGGDGHGALLLIGFDRRRTTLVRTGENGGRTLTEVNVVRVVTPVGAWQGAPLDLLLARPEGERAAVLLQSEDGHIRGAALAP